MPPKGDRGIILLYNNLNNYSNNTEMMKRHERTFLLKDNHDTSIVADLGALHVD